MTDRMIPVPESLIERIGRSSQMEPDEDALLELISILDQQTPTTETDAPSECVMRSISSDVHHADCAHLAEPGVPCNCRVGFLARRGAAEPPRIEDMAPGTRLVAQLHEAYSDNRPFTYMVIEVPRGKRLAATDGTVWSADQFDPTTIRDVTPPADAA